MAKLHRSWVWALLTLAFAAGSTHAVSLGVTRINLSTTGAQAIGSGSFEASVSADGRFVAFHSFATNLVPGDTNGVGDIFVRDRQLGTIERVSLTDNEDQALGGDSIFCRISADGRFVCFDSAATNLVPGDTNGFRDIFVRDRLFMDTRRVSIATDGTQGNHHSSVPRISGDGRYVSFDSIASNLVAGDTNGAYDVFVHDRYLGVTERVSVTAAGGSGAGREQLRRHPQRGWTLRSVRI